jgi:transcription initiation factor IIE alpha subunit
MPTKKKTTEITAGQIRELIHEIVTFTTDNVASVTAALMQDGTIDSDQATKLTTVLESTVKDSAFKVLSSKKF